MPDEILTLCDGKLNLFLFSRKNHIHGDLCFTTFVDRSKSLKQDLALKFAVERTIETYVAERHSFSMCVRERERERESVL